MEQLGKRESRSSTNLEAFINFLLQVEHRGKTYRVQHKSRIKSEAPILVKTWRPTRLSLMLYMESEDLQGNEDMDFLKLLFETLPQIKQLEQLVKGFKQLFAA